MPESVLGSGSLRVAASGETTVAALSSVDLATFSRKSGEVLSVFGWPADDVAGIEFAFDASGAVGLSIWIERTATPNQAKARAKNNMVADRVIRWAILAFVS